MPKLSVIESGSRDKDAVRNDLQLKLTAAATNWDRERQQLRDEIARAQQERDDDLATVRRAKTEEEAYQLWRSRIVQGPRHKQTVGEHKQSQQPPVQPIYARGYDTCPWTTRQTLNGPRTESPRS